MINCANNAYDSWDTELNKKYRALLAKLSPADAVKLKDSQRKWLAFRDAEFAFVGIRESGLLSVERVRITPSLAGEEALAYFQDVLTGGKQ